MKKRIKKRRFHIDLSSAVRLAKLIDVLARLIYHIQRLFFTV